MSFRGGLDLEGRIVIKVQLGNDVRKMLIHNDDITYDELALMMQRIYKGAVKQDDELTIKYKDEDGDLITIFDSSDVSFAIQTCNRQLKLVLYVNGLERNFDDAEVATIRKGLRDVRDMVNGLLDQINANTPRDDSFDAADEGDDISSQEEQPSLVNSAPMGTLHHTIDNKEFDPLNTSHSAITQLDSAGGGDKSASQSQYGGSQYGDQAAKSFDQLSMSDRQSNHSPTPAAISSSFGSTGYGVNTAQQNLSSQQPPASTSQLNSAYSSQAPSQPMSSGYYTNAPAASQYANPQMSVPTPSNPAQQAPQQIPQQSQLPQQPTQQYNYAQQWQQQNPQQPTQLHQPSQQMHPQQPANPQQMPPQQPANPQQMPPQQQQAYGGYALPGQPPQQQGMYGQPQQPTPHGGGGGSPNPYSKPGQIRGSYPRAMGAYPQLPPAGQQRPAYLPPQQ